MNNLSNYLSNDKENIWVAWVAHLNKDCIPTFRQQRKFIKRLNREYASVAYFHPLARNGSVKPHLHNLVCVPKSKIDPYLTNLFVNFDRENNDFRFEPLIERNIQLPVFDWQGMLNYIGNEWVQHDPEQIYFRPAITH
jgi:hypothetical protein